MAHTMFIPTFREFCVPLLYVAVHVSSIFVWKQRIEAAFQNGWKGYASYLGRIWNFSTPSWCSAPVFVFKCTRRWWHTWRYQWPGAWRKHDGSCAPPKYDFQNCLVPSLVGRPKQDHTKPVAVAVPVQTRLQSEQEARLALITCASTISAGEVRAVWVHADDREIEGDFGSRANWFRRGYATWAGTIESIRIVTSWAASLWRAHSCK